MCSGHDVHSQPASWDILSMDEICWSVQEVMWSQVKCDSVCLCDIPLFLKGNLNGYKLISCVSAITMVFFEDYWEADTGT